MQNWTFDLNFKSPIDLLEVNYECATNRQTPIWLKIDWINRRIWAETRDYTYDGQPHSESVGCVSVFALPDNIDATYIASNLCNIDNIQTMLDTVADGTDYQDSKRVVLSKDAYDILNHLHTSVFSTHIWDCHDGGIWYVDDWYGCTGENLDDDQMSMIIDPMVSIDEIVIMLCEDANAMNVVLDDDIDKYVIGLRRMFGSN